MARDFNGSTMYGGSTNSIFNLTANQAFYVGAWINMDSFTIPLFTLPIIAKRFGTSIAFYIDIEGSPAKLRVGKYEPGNEGNATWTISGWNTGEWHFVAGGYTGAAWKVDFDGTEVATNTTAVGPTNETTALRVMGDDALGRYVDGKMGEMVFLTSFPTVEQRAALGARVNPQRIALWSAHCPLYGTESPEPDLTSTAAALTLTNSPAQSAHAPVQMLWPGASQYMGQGAATSPPPPPSLVGPLIGGRLTRSPLTQGRLVA